MRETLKLVRERKLLEQNSSSKLKTSSEDSVGAYRMTTEKIKESFQKVSGHFEMFTDCENPEDQLVMREKLITSVKQLLKGLQEKD